MGSSALPYSNRKEISSSPKLPFRRNKQRRGNNGINDTRNKHFNFKNSQKHKDFQSSRGMNRFSAFDWGFGNEELMLFQLPRTAVMSQL